MTDRTGHSLDIGTAGTRTETRRGSRTRRTAFVDTSTKAEPHYPADSPKEVLH